MSDHHLRSPLLNEETAHRLLARAAALEAAHGSHLSLEQLRDAAREAGISADAFDRAVHEWTAATLPDASISTKPVSAGGRLRHWLRVQAMDFRHALAGAPVRNVLALAAFWGVLV